MAGDQPRMSSPAASPREPLQLLSVVIPARNEEGCISATIQHLNLELKLQGIPHEIVAVDDGSTDSTWPLLQELSSRIPECKPVQNLGEHGFGRAIIYGFAQIQGDAVVVMMADESDDCVTWSNIGSCSARLGRGVLVAVHPGRRRDRLSPAQAGDEPHGEFGAAGALWRAYERFHECVQGIPQGDRRLPAVSFPAFQPDGGTAAEDHSARLFVDNDSDHLAESSLRESKLKIREMGSRYLFIALYCWLEKYFSRGDYLAK